MLKVFQSVTCNGYKKTCVNLGNNVTFRPRSSATVLFYRTSERVVSAEMSRNILTPGDNSLPKHKSYFNSNVQQRSKQENGFGSKSSKTNAHFIENRYLLIDQTRKFSSSSSPQPGELIPEELSKRIYEEIAEETLESLYTYFDELLEQSRVVKDGDVSFSTGVLTIKLGKNGTYVINKQTPNKQIWLSSPTSGPKRYDFINKTWIYRHDGKSMYQLLNSEIPQLLGLTIKEVNFENNCTYGKASST